MTPQMVLQMLLLAEQLFTVGSQTYAQIKGDLSASDKASIDAAVTRSGAALDAARAQIDADAA